MTLDRPFSELNLWQRIFAEQWEGVAAWYEAKRRSSIPLHWRENVERMLGCGDVREAYYEYLCEDCRDTHKIGFSCKSRLCVRCVKIAVDGFLQTVRKVLFEGVTHRQIVLTTSSEIWPLVLSEPEFMKAYTDAGARAIRELVEQWRPKKKIRAGLMGVLQTHGRSGTANPHLHFVVSEGGIDKDNQWRNISYFDKKKLKKKWQYHVLTDLKKAVKGTEYEALWYGKLGGMFRKCPNGFDVDVDMKNKERGPVERLVIYLVKYVSSPPISIRRIENYDGRTVTFRYEEHRKGETTESLPVFEFIERMIQHLPEKNFRMVRYYGIYARPVRRKCHDLVLDVLKRLVRAAKKVCAYFARKKGVSPEQYRREAEDRFGVKQSRCPFCGSNKLFLLRIWNRTSGVIYDAARDAPNVHPDSVNFRSNRRHADAVSAPEQSLFPF